jgi:DNA repair protein RadC
LEILLAKASQAMGIYPGRLSCFYKEEIMFLREAIVRYKKSPVFVESKRFSNSREVFHAFREDIMSIPVEVFRVLFLNSKNFYLGFEDVSKGSLSTSICHPREVFWTAVHKRAAAIIVIHGHPSGDPAPSREDRDATQRIFKAGQILGIKVLDSIVIGDTDYFSFADSGILGELCQTN